MDLFEAAPGKPGPPMPPGGSQRIEEELSQQLGPSYYTSTQEC